MGLTDSLKCEVCGNNIDFDYSATEDDYKIAVSATPATIYDKVDDIINKYLVYKCHTCGQVYRYTYKDIEKAMRRKLTEKVLLLLVHNNISNKPAAALEKFLVYCGKCTGLDGSGSCTKTVFKKCEIKRFPTDVI